VFLVRSTLASFDVFDSADYLRVMQQIENFRYSFKLTPQGCSADLLIINREYIGHSCWQVLASSISGNCHPPPTSDLSLLTGLRFIPARMSPLSLLMKS
jgi:hypothetical protein